MKRILTLMNLDDPLDESTPTSNPIGYAVARLLSYAVGGDVDLNTALKEIQVLEKNERTMDRETVDIALEVSRVALKKLMEEAKGLLLSCSSRHATGYTSTPDVIEQAVHISYLAFWVNMPGADYFRDHVEHWSDVAAKKTI